MKFELENIFRKGIEDEWNTYVDAIIKDYNINAVTMDIDGHEVELWCYDDDCAELFSDYSIGLGRTIDFAKKFDFDVDYQPVGLDYGDYIETTELKQNGNTYLCKVYCAHNGVGADYAFALFDIEKKGE